MQTLIGEYINKYLIVFMFSKTTFKLIGFVYSTGVAGVSICSSAIVCAVIIKKPIICTCSAIAGMIVVAPSAIYRGQIAYQVGEKVFTSLVSKYPSLHRFIDRNIKYLF